MSRMPGFQRQQLLEKKAKHTGKPTPSESFVKPKENEKSNTTKPNTEQAKTKGGFVPLPTLKNPAGPPIQTGMLMILDYSNDLPRIYFR